MGTNYYLRENVCPTCGHSKGELHIGKSSYGWCFSLRIYPEHGINDLPDWEERWKLGQIFDEYDRPVTADELRLIILARATSPPQEFLSSWLAKNSAVPGPFGLARHALSDFCVKHGSGTYDCMIGDFS